MSQVRPLMLDSKEKNKKEKEKEGYLEKTIVREIGEEKRGKSQTP